MRRKLDKVVLIRGAGEVASGVACRLFRCNFRVVLFELPEPRAVRRPVAFSEAVYDGRVNVEGIPGYFCDTAHEARTMAERGGSIPILVDPEAETTPAFSPVALIDARMQGTNEGISIDDAPLVIGLGPGFVCGEDVHRVVETRVGPRLGRVLYEGQALPDPEILTAGDDVPCETVLSPGHGTVVHATTIGDLVEPNEVLCTVGGVEARSRVGGLVTGLVRQGIEAREGWRVARIDSRGREADAEEIGFRPMAIAGGALEAILATLSVRVRI
jgi:xanthine dehydrogenase accessory factor